MNHKSDLSLCIILFLLLKINNNMKACLIGYNITNFVLATTLTKKGFEVDIVFEKKQKKIVSNRTIGISKHNIDYLGTIKINLKKFIWPINKIKIYNLKKQENEKINFESSKGVNFFLIKYQDIFKITEHIARKNKKIRFKTSSNTKILNIEKKNNYDLVINSDSKNPIIKKFFFSKLSKDYKTSAFTGILRHKKILNNTAFQIFTKYGPIAFLPCSAEETSIVFSVQKKYLLKINDIRNEILNSNPIFEVKGLDDLEKFDLKFSYSRKYIHKNILCFGDALHKFHPLAGQGFNMTIRDIELLNKIIEKKIECGLEIDNSILFEFQKKIKSLNYIFGIGINFINDFFKIDSLVDGKLSKNIFKIFNRNTILKKYSIKFADSGVNF